MRRALPALLAAALLALDATAYVPSAEKVSEAIARANAQARRAQALRVEVVLRDPVGHEQGRGTLLLAPRGEVRLEIETSAGTERRRLAGNREVATRNGLADPSPRPLLPPLGLLQEDSGEGLRDRLRGLGGAPERVELGLEGEHDCYVLGGRSPLLLPGAAPRPPVSLWVDLASFEAVRIDRGDGVRFRLGPTRLHGELRLPAWIDIEAPGRPASRLELLRASPAQSRGASR